MDEVVTFAPVLEALRVSGIMWSVLFLTALFYVIGQYSYFLKSQNQPALLFSPILKGNKGEFSNCVAYKVLAVVWRAQWPSHATLYTDKCSSEGRKHSYSNQKRAVGILKGNIESID